MPYFPTVVMVLNGFHIWPGLHCSAVWAGSRSLSGDLSPRPTSLTVLYSISPSIDKRVGRFSFAHNSVGIRPDNTCDSLFILFLALVFTYRRVF